VTTPQREVLERSIGFRDYLAIGLGAIIGIGWVMYSGNWLLDGGPVGAMLAFALVGVLLLPIGICYAEMTSAIPVAGGEMAFTFKAFGTFVSFVTAWALGLSYISVLPFETIAIGSLVEATWPALATDAIYSIDGYKVSWSTLIPGVLSGAYVIWLNYEGAKNSTRFQKWVMYLLFACTLVFTTTALIKGDISNLKPMFADEGNFWAVGPSSIISVLVVASWFMGGFDTIPQAAEESGVKMDPKNLGVAIISCIVIGALFYVLIILSVGISVSSEEMGVLLQQKNVMPTAEVFRAAFGYEWAAKLVLVAALCGLITGLNGFFIASTRLLFSLGRGGMLPHWFAKVHPVHGTPVNAIWFLGAIALIGPFVGKAAMAPIVNSGAIAFNVALMMTALAAIRLRYTEPDLERPFKAKPVWLYLGAIIAGSLVLLMLIPSSPGALSAAEWVIVCGWVALGLVGFIIRRKAQPMDHQERTYLILGK